MPCHVQSKPPFVQSHRLCWTMAANPLLPFAMPGAGQAPQGDDGVIDCDLPVKELPVVSDTKRALHEIEGKPVLFNLGQLVWFLFQVYEHTQVVTFFNTCGTWLELGFKVFHELFGSTAGVNYCDPYSVAGMCWGWWLTHVTKVMDNVVCVKIWANDWVSKRIQPLISSALSSLPTQLQQIGASKCLASKFGSRFYSEMQTQLAFDESHSSSGSESFDMMEHGLFSGMNDAFIRSTGKGIKEHNSKAGRGKGNHKGQVVATVRSPGKGGLAHIGLSQIRPFPVFVMLFLVWCAANCSHCRHIVLVNHLGLATKRQFNYSSHHIHLHTCIHTMFDTPLLLMVFVMNRQTHWTIATCFLHMSSSIPMYTCAQMQWCASPPPWAAQEIQIDAYKFWSIQRDMVQAVHLVPWWHLFDVLFVFMTNNSMLLCESSFSCKEGNICSWSATLPLWHKHVYSKFGALSCTLMMPLYCTQGK